MNVKKESLKEVLEEYELYSELRYPDDLIDDIIGALDACADNDVYEHKNYKFDCPECSDLKKRTILYWEKGVVKKNEEHDLEYCLSVM